MSQKTYDDGTYRKPRKMAAEPPPLVSKEDREWYNADLPDGVPPMREGERRPPDYPRTGVLMMALRKRVAELTHEPWHAVVKLRPVSDDPYCACQVSARMPGGETEWVAEFTPDEFSYEDVDALCNDIVQMRQDALAKPETVKPDAIVTNESGEVIIDNRAADQRKTVTLANGNSIEVRVRASAEKESETDERARLSKEMADFPVVMIMVDKDDWVGWNGIPYHLTPGPHTVPKPVADIWFESITEMRRARARMSAVLTDEQNWAWRNAETRGVV